MGRLRIGNGRGAFVAEATLTGFMMCPSNSTPSKRSVLARMRTIARTDSSRHCGIPFVGMFGKCAHGYAA